MERGKSCKITNMIRVKGSERRPFVFISRLNIVQHDSYQADEIIIEIEEWKQKVAEDYVKRFSRVLLGALETSILSYRNCIRKSKICYTTKAMFIFINKLSFHTGNIVKLQ